MAATHQLRRDLVYLEDGRQEPRFHDGRDPHARAWHPRRHRHVQHRRRHRLPPSPLRRRPTPGENLGQLRRRSSRQYVTRRFRRHQRASRRLRTGGRGLRHRFQGRAPWRVTRRPRRDRHGGVALDARRQPRARAGILPEEFQPGRDAVLILTDANWRRRFAADAGVVGQTLSVDGAKFTILGVLPPNVLRYSADFLKPLVAASYPAGRDHRDLDVFARLRPGVTLAAAQAELDVLGRRSRRPLHRRTSTTASTSSRWTSTTRRWTHPPAAGCC